MANESITEKPSGRRLQARHAWLIAAACLVAGLATGYLLRGWRMPASSVQARVTMPHPPMSGRRPSMQEMQQMADRQAAPILAKLEKDPKNADLLVQVG